MNPMRTAVIRELLEQAIEMSAEEQAAFLDRHCGSDDELRTEIESLLNVHGKGEDFLERPLIEVLPLPEPQDDDASQLVGERIGRYTLRRLIGTGGMGAVYEAEQDEPQRIVAIKIMRLRFPSRTAHRRFRQEVTILGRLNHPNITQIIEAGTHYAVPAKNGGEGLPYFVMEFIKGATPSINYVVEQRLSTRERLKLFKTICDAVHYGHQKGVIHRDLKPANIVINDEEQPKIIDFGVARISEPSFDLATTMTNVGQLVGTIQYMSPEQINGDPHDLDIRSDVYSLGVVLFELLSGELPYKLPTSSMYQASRTIIEEMPSSLGSISSEFKGDLNAIVTKAMAKNRGQRYSSAAELAHDIERYLNGEAVEARPPRAWAKIVGQTSRHPIIASVVITSIALTLVFLSAYLTRSSYLNRPAYVVLSEHPGVARLFSVDGLELHKWDVSGNQRIWDAKFVRRNTDSGSQTLVISGWSGPDPDTKVGTVCAFDVDVSYDDPVWDSHVTDKDLPEALDNDKYRGADFGVRYLAMEDIFSEVPGDEIVVIYHHTPHSAALLRVLDLEGNVLYEVWHDGHMGSVYWMSEPRLLVTTAFSSVATWNERSDQPLRAAYPTVVLAVRPKYKFRSSGWTTSEDLPTADQETLAWYRCLLPDQVAEFYSVIDVVRLNNSTPGPSRSAQLILGLRDHPNARAFAIIDEHGNIVPHSISPNPELTQILENAPGIPALESITLGNLPPLLEAESSSRDQ